MDGDGVRCSHCGDSEERGEWVWCPDCRSLHHEGCWETRGGCAEPGCETESFVRECPKVELHPKTGLHRVDLDTPLETFLTILAVGCAVATLVVVFLGSVEDVITCIILTGLFAYLRKACDCTYWLDMDERRVLYQRDLSGLGRRREVCRFDEVAAVAVQGGIRYRRRRRRYSFSLGGDDPHKDWEYWVVLILKRGDEVPVSNHFPADPGRADLRARALAEDIGVPAIHSEPCAHLSFEWNAGAEEVRVRKGGFSLSTHGWLRSLVEVAGVAIVFFLVTSLLSWRGSEDRDPFSRSWTLRREADAVVFVRDDDFEARFKELSPVEERYAVGRLIPLPRLHRRMASLCRCMASSVDENGARKAKPVYLTLLPASGEMSQQMLALFPDLISPISPPASHLRLVGHRIQLESLGGRGARMASAIRGNDGATRAHVHVLVDEMSWEN